LTANGEHGWRSDVTLAIKRRTGTVGDDDVKVTKEAKIGKRLGGGGRR
jgi:hypothetical protein